MEEQEQSQPTTVADLPGDTPVKGGDSGQCENCGRELTHGNPHLITGPGECMVWR